MFSKMSCPGDFRKGDYETDFSDPGKVRYRWNKSSRNWTEYEEQPESCTETEEWTAFNLGIV